MQEVTPEEIRQTYIKLKSNIYYDRGELFRRKNLAIFETDLDESVIFSIGHYNYDKTFWESFEKITIDAKFEVIANALNNYYEGGNVFFEHYIKKIACHYLPKKVTIKSGEKSDNNFITNQRVAEEYSIDRATAFINIPTELEILNVLWITRYGWRLDKSLDDCCFGNRLILNQEKTAVIKGAGLFKPYFKQYQNWRDESVSKAKDLLKNGSDIAFLNLDFRDYFYSVSLSLKKLDDELFGASYKNDDPIQEIFKKMHVNFTQLLLKKQFPYKNNRKLDKADPEVMLPIGLLSSYIIGNWYLKEFDKQIIQKVRPSYYGRYVDDILIVFENPDFKFNELLDCKKIAFDFAEYKTQYPDLKNINYSDLTIVEKFILENFTPIVKLRLAPEYLIPVLKKDDGDTSIKKIFELNCIEGIFFQGEKTILYYFDVDESIAALDKLKQDIEERASEFRDFPEDEDVELDFDSQAYQLVFDGTESKVRTLKDYKENRYGLSVFLANRIFSALRRENNQHEIEGSKINKFFKGLNVIEYFKLWEKIFTYFVVNNNQKGFVEFYKNVLSELLKLYSSTKIKSTNVEYADISASLIEHFNLSFEMAIALNPSFFNKEIEVLTSLEYFQSQNEKFVSFLSFFRGLTKYDSYYRSRFRRSNLVRHDYVVHPLFNYAFAQKSSSYDLVNKNLLTEYDKINITRYQKRLSPRAVKFYECCLFEVYKHMLNNSQPNEVRNEYYFPDLWLKYPEHYLDNAYMLYRQINEIQEPTNVLTDEDFKKKIYRSYPNTHNSEPDSAIEGSEPKHQRANEDAEVKEIWVNSAIKKDKFKIGIVNTEVKLANIEASLHKKPNKNKARFSVLSRSLKEARICNVDFLLFPEFYLPYEQLPSLVKYSVKNQIAIVVGLEHWNVNDIAFNFIVTILPFEVNGVKDALVYYRLKNHYAHIEESLIRGYGFKVPKPDPYHYNIFNWKGLYFSPFYCFELADIKHRSYFRSKLDLLIISEWNKDVNYYSNIVESLARDIHAYVAQVNTSNFGDSRITQPKETAVKDIIKLKGGENDALLVGEIDIKALRSFQLKGFDLGKKDKNGFKPTPPDFERNFVKKRIDNKPIL